MHAAAVEDALAALYRLAKGAEDEPRMSRAAFDAAVAWRIARTERWLRTSRSNSRRNPREQWRPLAGERATKNTWMGPMDETRVDALIAYAISLTGKPDSAVRSLGRVQLMKLVFLADLAVAQKDESSRTYTGATWRFLHFGPFASDVAGRIEPAASAIRATVSAYRHDETEADHVRWSGDDVELPSEARRAIPLVARMAIERALKEFGADTASLLHAVYATPPMLHAAPGERLDFSVRSPANQTAPRISEADARQRRLVGAKLRERLAAASERGRRMVRVTPEYDERFAALSGALGVQAGDAGEFDGVVEFPPDLWKSGWRGGGGEIP